YLGTYVPEQRFGLYRGADWDVWSHKYNLMGLLHYYQYSGNAASLEACRKIGDLLVRTFPAKKSILDAGTHVGMAATSILEPMVLLYRHTGEERYLEFCRYIVKAWDEAHGPKIVQTLLAERQVNKTANAKAYEMLSNLVGLCELARATGDRQMLEPVLIAWQDVVSNRLYLTGSASQGEHFRDDHQLPNQTDAHVAETCVTTTWIQLNSQLLRLTGEARFGDELEKTWFNHLAAAQRPDGEQWCYFTALEGTKPYGPGINCCVSSGPRGMALVPQHACLVSRRHDGQPDTLLVNLFGPWQATVPLGGQPVRVKQVTDFPRSGQATLTFQSAQPANFGLRIRAPAWAQPMTLKIGGAAVTAEPAAGWLAVPPRTWKNGEQIELQLSLQGRLVMGEYGNTGRAAVAWGPIVLAYDADHNPGLPAPPMLALADSGGKPPVTPHASEDGGLGFQALVRSVRLPEPRPAVFVPFAEAGAGGGRYQVWLHAPGAALPSADSLSAFARESRSRPGNVAGSITDGDSSSLVVTFDGQSAAEDWYAVEFDAPVSIRRVTFAHGKTFHDGGWFDVGGGKPQIQIRSDAASAWETVAKLEDYPATTATDSRALQSGQMFLVRLPQPVTAVALRVLGKPASGDNPQQAFSSCAELQAFAQP
ncbi:MAG: glycoside hydrolase family 127 protein, partial [Pirellulaceae bacterium]|nr:glycoside hydrolase family 127 protein [Pirellulaceae bacterium]